MIEFIGNYKRQTWSSIQMLSKSVSKNPNVNNPMQKRLVSIN